MWEPFKNSRRANLRALTKSDDLISVYRVQCHTNIFIISQLSLRADIQMKRFVDS